MRWAYSVFLKILWKSNIVIDFIFNFNTFTNNHETLNSERERIVVFQVAKCKTSADKPEAIATNRNRK